MTEEGDVYYLFVGVKAEGLGKNMVVHKGHFSRKRNLPETK